MSGLGVTLRDVTHEPAVAGTLTAGSYEGTLRCVISFIRFTDDALAIYGASFAGSTHVFTDEIRQCDPDRGADRQRHEGKLESVQPPLQLIASSFVPATDAISWP